MAKKTIKTISRATPIVFPDLFKLKELASKAGIDYHRLVHVCYGNRIGGFTADEKQKLEQAVLVETKKFLKVLGSTKAPVELTSAAPLA